MLKKFALTFGALIALHTNFAEAASPERDYQAEAAQVDASYWAAYNTVDPAATIGFSIRQLANLDRTAEFGQTRKSNWSTHERIWMVWTKSEQSNWIECKDRQGLLTSDTRHARCSGKTERLTTH